MSARLLVAEPLAHALAQAAILVCERDRWRWSVILFALGVLAKETILVFVAGYLLFLLAQRQWRRFAELALGVGLPFLLWQAVLWGWLGSPGLGSGGAGATGWEIIPFQDLWSRGAIDVRVLGLLALVVMPLTVIPTLLSLWATGRDL